MRDDTRQEMVHDQRTQECPFKIGDRVIFRPDKRAIGWSYAGFDRLRLKPGDIGVITRIENGRYLFLDDDRGGFHWECFKEYPE